uniref:melanotransferrin n=1 Tax=Euleptes europaea TaxID=460621 RepID=UPI002540F5B9|nr:melanotransferrin [Euleptes europaea]
MLEGGGVERRGGSLEIHQRECKKRPSAEIVLSGHCWNLARSLARICPACLAMWKKKQKGHLYQQLVLQKRSQGRGPGPWSAQRLPAVAPWLSLNMEERHRGPGRSVARQPPGPAENGSAEAPPAVAGRACPVQDASGSPGRNPASPCPSTALRLALSLLRWCTVSDQELAKCSEMSKAFAGANLRPLLACVNGGSAGNCTAMVNASLADVITLDGGTIYQAGKEYNLKPVVGEAYGQDLGTSYYAVAVVRANSSLTINSLRGAKTCHTGINRTVGWNVPVGFLIDSGRMAVMGCQVLDAVDEYFDASCVPGASVVGRPPLSLCNLCKGDGAGHWKCEASPKELYYDYVGAFRCLVEAAGDVAFVKHSTVSDATGGSAPPSWAQKLQPRDFQLLCRDGTRAEVTEWRRCHLARVPAHAVVARQDTAGGLVFQLLDQGQQMFNGEASSFQMFDSTAYGGKNLLFKDSTTHLVPVEQQTFQAWLGEEYLHAVRGLDCDPTRLPSFLRWCVLSTEEIWKCSQMAAAFKDKNLKPEIHCVSAASPEECMERIQKRDIDAVVLAGKDVYTAGKKYGLVPAAGERYADGDTNATYYAVAVVRRDVSNAFTIHELKGKKSCHTGYQRMAGWNVPVGTLLRKGFLQPQGCSSLLQAVSTFFSASCVPVARRDDDYPASLCELCIGDDKGNHKCNASDQERYYGYAGAFRCLAEHRGDVAFVKHSSVFENTDGNNTASWASPLQSSDFQLLCPNGARAEVSQFAQCHWGQVPARAVMVHPDTNALAVYGLLSRAQDFFGNDTNGQGFKMFDSADFQGRDLIFRDSTVEIVPVGEETTFSSWLEQQFLASLEGLESLRCSGAVPERDLERSRRARLASGVELHQPGAVNKKALALAEDGRAARRPGTTRRPRVKGRTVLRGTYRGKRLQGYEDLRQFWALKEPAL